MTEVDHYALSLLYFGLAGIQFGAGLKTIDDLKKREIQRIDFVHIFGLLVACIYGILGSKFVQGGHFTGVITWAAIWAGANFGRGIATVMNEKSMRIFFLGMLTAIPLLYHYVLI